MAAFMLNRRVRQLLKEKKMTQATLAEKLDIETGYLSEILNGHPLKRWNIDHIDAMTTIFNVDPWQLFVDPMQARYPGKELVGAYNRAPDHKQKTVNDILGIDQASYEIVSKKNNDPAHKHTQRL